MEVPAQIFQEFGGGRKKSSHPKKARPLSKSRSMHFVFRSSMAKGSYSFLHQVQRRKIHQILKRNKSLVKLENLKIENGQIQMILRSRRRGNTVRFLRVFTGLLARSILSAEKNKKVLAQKRFWSFRPYSRVIKTKRFGDSRKIISYLIQRKILIPRIGFNSS